MSGPPLYRGRAEHEDVFLVVGADDENLFADDFKSPLFVEGDGLGVFRKGAEPDGARAFGAEDRKGAVEERAGESCAVSGGMNVELT